MSFSFWDTFFYMHNMLSCLNHFLHLRYGLYVSSFYNNCFVFIFDSFSVHPQFVKVFSGHAWFKQHINCFQKKEWKLLQLIHGGVIFYLSFCSNLSRCWKFALLVTLMVTFSLLTDNVLMTGQHLTHMVDKCDECGYFLFIGKYVVNNRFRGGSNSWWFLKGCKQFNMTFRFVKSINGYLQI